MKKYDYLITLAGEIIKEGNNFLMPDNFDGLAQGGKMRLDAAIKMFEDKMAGNIIVVGGKVRGSDDKKVDVMAEYLFRKGIPKEKIIKLYSETNTRGNAIAIKYYLKKEKLFTKKIGLLTNFFHLPRAIKFFVMENLCPEPIVAESILLEHPDYGLQKIHQFYINTKMLERLNQELEGISALEKGEYQVKTN